VNGKTLTMAGNPYATAGTPNSSPGKRFAVVGTPVTFACTNDTATGKGTLLRYWGYRLECCANRTGRWQQCADGR
jgi:MSHA biogenesis protein MshO